MNKIIITMVLVIMIWIFEQPPHVGPNDIDLPAIDENILLENEGPGQQNDVPAYEENSIPFAEEHGLVENGI